MTNNLIINLDILCVLLFSIHLFDVDTTLKIIASTLVIATNAIAIIKMIKNKAK